MCPDTFPFVSGFFCIQMILLFIKVFTIFKISVNAFKLNLKNTIYRAVLIWTCLIFSYVNLNGQVLGLELLDGKPRKDIKFNYEQGFILVDVRFNNSLPLTFILDTGAEHVILFNKTLTDIFGFKYEKRISLVGSDLEKEVSAYISRNIPIQLEECKTVLRDIIILEEDFLHLEELTGKPIHGIIGSRFLRGLVLDVDYQKEKLSLINSSLFKPPSKDKFTTIPIKFAGHKPYLESYIINGRGDTINTNLLIDTGSALPFLIFIDSHPSLQLPENFIKGNLGKGLGGDLEGFLGKVRLLEISPYQFSNLITRFQSIPQNVDKRIYEYRNGLIGNPILSRFRVVIDFVKNKMYLRPNRNYDKTFKYDKSGLTIYAIGEKLDKYYIKDVIEGSPADLAGIKTGDMLKRVGFWPAHFFTLGAISKKFERKEGTKFKLTLERNGVRYKTHIILRDMLKVTP